MEKEIKGWKIERSEYNDFQTLLNQYKFQIGDVTATIQSNIKQMLEHHPVDWISAAIQKAADDKKKSWGPIKDLILTWDENGKPNSIKPIPALEDTEEMKKATAAVTAKLKESVKEGKAINKEDAAVVKEAEKIIEQPKQKESVKAAITQTKAMDYQDRATYLEVVERRIEEIDRMAGEMSQEAGTIKEYIDSDPVANYRGKKYGQKVGLIYLLDKYGKFPDTVSKKQAELILMGRELKPAAVSAKGRVPWHYVIDELADHFKMGEQEFVNHIENIAYQKSRLDDMDGLVKEAEDRKKELEEIREAVRKYNDEQRHITLPEEPKIKQEIGQPEAGIQKGMLGEDKEIRPQGKGKVTQINLLEHGRLQEIRAKVAKSEDIHGDIMAEVKKRQEDRTPRAVSSDNVQTAQHVVKGPDIKKWLKHPEHFDIRNVDTKRARRPQRRGAAGARVRTSR